MVFPRLVMTSQHSSGPCQPCLFFVDFADDRGQSAEVTYAWSMSDVASDIASGIAGLTDLYQGMSMVHGL